MFLVNLCRIVLLGHVDYIFVCQMLELCAIRVHSHDLIAPICTILHQWHKGTS